MMEKSPLPAKIAHERGTLKRRSLQDAYAAFECIDSDRDRLREFLPWVDFNKSVEDQIWYIHECLREWDECSLFDYALFNTEGEYLGSLGVHAIKWDHHVCEIGYWLHQRFEGQGYISSALKALEEVLFEKGFNRLEIRCDPNNQKSAAVAKRNNYVYEGCLRQEKLFRDHYRDTAVYAKLKHPFPV